MKDKVTFNRSSCLVSWPALAASLLLGALAAFFGLGELAAVLILLFLLAAASRLWAFATARKLFVSVDSSRKGMFPGDTTTFEITVRNDKFLPVVWLELFFPLSEDLCLTPEHCREPEDWEQSELKEEKASVRLVGEKRYSFFLWYETLRVSSYWTANRRGVYSMEGWRLRTGDGFGLTQVERRIPREDVEKFAVYPKLIKVSPDLFLRNLWNADTGTRGVMEDPTVIRSTRDYLTTDSLKHINWRLAARCLPLTVNIYEDILPKSVHFLFDGESFSGPIPHRQEMEDALSILGSELVRLSEAQVQCGLSLCQGAGGAAVNLFAGEDTEALLCALAAYQPQPDKWDTDEGRVVPQVPVFDAAPIYEAVQRVGRFYYIAYDTDCLSTRPLLKRLDRTCTSILTYQEPKPFGEFESVCLCRLKEEKEHG